MKIDHCKHKERYLSWKASVNERIPEVSERNSELILDYLLDTSKNVTDKG